MLVSFGFKKTTQVEGGGVRGTSYEDVNKTGF